MTTNTDTERDARRLTAAIRLVLRRYWGQVRRRRAAALGALVLPALGDVLTYYAPPLVVARLLGAFARGERFRPPSSRRTWPRSRGCGWAARSSGGSRWC